MRRIEHTGAFKRDFIQVKAAPKRRDVDAILVPVLQLLATDQPLPPRLCDHALTGDWKDNFDITIPWLPENLLRECR